MLFVIPTDTYWYTGAANFQVLTYVLVDPTLDLATPSQYTQLQPSVSFVYLGRSISTLSDTGLVPGTDATGLLYTPDLDISDPCYNATAPYIPRNVTRQGSLPNAPFDLIAVAPWISPACTLSFLQSASQDPVNGFLFFLPNNSTDQPPSGFDAQWNLGDGGEWKKTYRFPAFAIPGPTGSLLMQASSRYSGNLTNVPYGNILAAAYDPRDYVRLYVDIGIAPSSSLPSLWVFLLIVLGILLGVIFATSIFMHCLQRRRRQVLRQRVVNGEIDLEALGIQRLTVPQHILDRMPLFEFGSGRTLGDEDVSEQPMDGKNEQGIAVTSPADNHHRSSSSPPSTRSPVVATSNFQNLINQPTCAICLDDFVTASEEVDGSAIRQLPCHHIFHPECVDNFLRENSSLCPMCKHSALPVGYCPRTITNAMVRRERIMRRMRERADAGENGDLDSHQSGRRSFVLSGLRRLFMSQRARPPSTSHAMAEMIHTSEAPSTANGAQQRAAVMSPAVPTSDGNNRREWARQRALAMLGRRPLVAEHETENPSRWRKVLGGVFPGAA